MEKTHFDVYALKARTFDNLTEISGRYLIQEEAERRIVAEVAAKLRLDARDSMLEIGCGVGNLLIPISFLVNDITGIDHPDVLAKLSERFQSTKVNLLGGNFFDVQIQQKFDKILIYSVLSVLPDEESVLAFVRKACGLLKPGGRMLLGDLASVGHKERFMQSETGKAFSAQWNKMRASQPGSEEPASEQSGVVLSDEFLLKLLLSLRQDGWHSYLLEQSGDLPFGHTREDILVVGPEAG